MKKLLVILCAAICAASSMGQDAVLPKAPPQDGKVIRRIQIKSADPQLIAFLLQGNQNFILPPEISTIMKLRGFGGGQMGGGR
jgi:hypothetical protein